MSAACPDSARMAAFASHGDLDDAVERVVDRAADPADANLAAHVRSCAVCRKLVAEQREVRALAASLTPPTVLTRSHREELAAEIMARADLAGDRAAGTDDGSLAQEHASELVADAGSRIHDQASDVGADDDARASELARRRRRTAGIIFATTLAAAAALVIVALTSMSPTSAPEVARGEPTTPVAPIVAPQPEVHEVAPAPSEPAPVEPAPRELAGVTGAKARFSRETTDAHDVVRLRDGELAIDALASRAVEIIAGTTRIAIPTSTKATVVARAGVIESVAVFAGSVEVTAGDRKATIEAGAVWDRTTIKVSDSTPVTPETADKPAPTAPARPATDEAAISLQAFRDGWTALRAGDHRTAIAAFDRASDPVVAEDAAYWAANATERAGDRDAAAKRYTDFVTKFPASPRAGSARAAITRLGTASGPASP